MNRVRCVAVRALGAAIFGCTLAMAPSARAYDRTTVDGFPDRPLAWAHRDVAVELASATSTRVAPGDLRAALDLSLATWSRAGGCTDLVLTDAGEALATRTNLDGGAYDGRNRVVVRETSWPALAGTETLALTTILYDRDTGAILDADIDLNASVHAFSTTTPPAAGADDVQNTLTHELGHLLGFDHSADPSATMYGSALVSDLTKRDLAPDDVRAVCDVYPTGAPSPTVWPPPAGGGCSVRPAGARHGLPAWVLALGIATIIGRRARERARRAARAAGTACAARARAGTAAAPSRAPRA